MAGHTYSIQNAKLGEYVKIKLIDIIKHFLCDEPLN